MYDIIIIGAGPAGISMAVEAVTAGISHEKILLIEKAHEHSFSLKKFYPEGKLVTANFKGVEPVCNGVMCLRDSSKHEAISYLDQTITQYGLHIQYLETVQSISKKSTEQKFSVTTDKQTYETTLVVIAIGILGKPNKPEYQLPASLKNKIFFDITSAPIEHARVLVVGGGDSASEYCQFLAQSNNTVTLSYRKNDFSRMNVINKESLLALAERNDATLLLGSNIEKVVDVQGKPEVHFAGGELNAQQFDFIVYALGGTTPHNFLKTVGIQFIGNEPQLSEGFESNIPGLFLVGDLSAGAKGGSIIGAFNSANSAMKKICNDYLECKL